MTSNNLGTKRVCPKCDAKFYDFGAVNPIKCPKCSHAWREGVAKKAPASKPKKELKPTHKPVRKLADEDEALLGAAGDLPDVEDDEALDMEPMEDEGVELTSLDEVEEHEEKEENDPNGDDAEDDMFGEMGGDKLVDDFEEEYDDEEEEEDEDEEDDESNDEGDDDVKPGKRRR